MAEGEDEEVETKERLYKKAAVTLIGHLQHMCHVVRTGRVFLRRMIQLSTVAKKLHHCIRLNKGFRSDLEW